MAGRDSARRVAPVLLAVLCAMISLAAAVAAPGVALAADSVPVYRLYNEWTGEHLFTRDAGERARLLPLGWKDEGEGWRAPTSSSTPVYRLFNPFTGEHLYTAQSGERDTLKGIGWRYEAIAWYSDDARGVPVYRLYNPWERDHQVRAHHYTAARGEYDELDRGGWDGESVVWYGVAKTGSPGDQEEMKVDPNYPSKVDYDDAVEVEPDADYIVLDDTVIATRSSLPSDVKVGDIIVLDPTDENPQGASMRVTKVTDLIVCGEPPELDEVYDTIDAQGVATAEGAVFIPEPGVTENAGSGPKALAIEGGDKYGWTYDFDWTLTYPDDFIEGEPSALAESWANAHFSGSDASKVKRELPRFERDDPSAKGSVTAGLKGQIGLSEEYSLYFDADHLDKTRIYSKTTVSVECTPTVEGHFEGKIPLGRLIIPTPAAGLTVDMDVFLTMGVDGHITLEFSGEGSAVINWTKDTTKHIEEPLSFERRLTMGDDIRIDCSVGPTLVVTLNAAGLSCYDVEFDAAGNVHYESIDRDFSFVCTDLDGWLSFDVKLGTNSELVKMIEEAWARWLWFLDPLTLHAEFNVVGLPGEASINGQLVDKHWENGAEVRECTWGRGNCNLNFLIKDLETGAPLEGTSYTVKDGQGRVIKQGTSTNGPMTINGLNPGEHTIEAERDGYYPVVETVTLVEGYSSLHEVAMSPKSALILTVVNENGDPLAGAKYQVLDGGKVIREGTTAVTPITIDLPLGTFTVRVTADFADKGYEPKEETFTIWSSNPQSLLVGLQLQGSGGSYTGSVQGQTLSLGEGHSAVITTDGSLYLWGSNQRWQLGVTGYGWSSTPEKLQVDASTTAASLDAATPVGGFAAGGDVIYGDMHGRVTDTNGIPVIGASIRLRMGLNNYGGPYYSPYANEELVVITNSSGEFKITSYTGQYTLECTKEGYETAYRNIEIGSTEDCNIVMTSLNQSGSTGGESGGGTGGESGGEPEKPITYLTFKQVSLGYTHSAAIASDGSLYTWGDNEYGQLGDGTKTKRADPKKVLSNVKAVSLGREHSAAITDNGDLYMWGSNKYGQLGDGTNTDVLTPKKVLSSIKSVSLGCTHSAAIATDGSLYTWGSNITGELGDNSTVDKNTPQRLTSITDVVYISMGDSSSAAITSNGRLYTWGSDANDELGYHITGISRQLTPQAVPNMPSVKAVSLGRDFGAAIAGNGDLYTWGLNNGGQLGDGTIGSSSINAPGDLEKRLPKKVLSNIAFVELGGYHGAAITNDGRLLMWGANSYGQLGDGTLETRPTPTPITIGSGLLNAKALSADPVSQNGAVTSQISWNGSDGVDLDASRQSVVPTSPILTGLSGYQVNPSFDTMPRCRAA